ncbi:hypothetical protein AVEN_196738-1 [Araneus ventricosus]|uniref:Uncharacterized protein n=1 Tax=Araneus ventricosus TaxID=182803 RepID=A0A4Y2HA21_ARAVE|nr:hypothetical protein AVEN_196738-1 [Araneus ventricosus]
MEECCPLFSSNWDVRSAALCNRFSGLYSDHPPLGLGKEVHLLSLQRFKTLRNESLIPPQCQEQNRRPEKVGSIISAWGCSPQGMNKKEQGRKAVENHTPPRIRAEGKVDEDHLPSCCDNS